MSDTYFRVYSGLLTPEHKKRIGPALWEFLWCIDRVTSESGQDGQKSGIVLGGSPVSYSDVAKDLGVGKSTVKRNFERLEEEKYIDLKRTPYGHIITVNKSKKWSAKNSTGKSAKNGTSAESGTESAEYGTQGAENGHSNKDNTETIQRHNKAAANAREENLMSEESDGVPSTDLLGESVPSDEISHTSPENVVLDKFITLRGGGFFESPKDRVAAKEIISAGVSPDDACKWIEECFERYKPRHKRDKIRSLEYCVGYILDRHHEKQNKEIKLNRNNKKSDNVAELQRLKEKYFREKVQGFD